MEPDNGRDGENGGGGLDLPHPVLYHLGLVHKEQDYRPTQTADIQGLVVLVQHQDRMAVYHIRPIIRGWPVPGKWLGPPASGGPFGGAAGGIWGGGDMEYGTEARIGHAGSYLHLHLLQQLEAGEQGGQPVVVAVIDCLEELLLGPG